MSDNKKITINVEPTADSGSIKLIELDDIKKATNEFNKLSSAFPKSNKLKKLARLLDPFIKQENNLKLNMKIY